MSVELTCILSVEIARVAAAVRLAPSCALATLTDVGKLDGQPHGRTHHGPKGQSLLLLLNKVQQPMSFLCGCTSVFGLPPSDLFPPSPPLPLPTPPHFPYTSLALFPSLSRQTKGCGLHYAIARGAVDGEARVRRKDPMRWRLLRPRSF